MKNYRQCNSNNKELYAVTVDVTEGSNTSNTVRIELKVKPPHDQYTEFFLIIIS